MNAGEKERVRSELDLQYKAYDAAKEGAEKASARGKIMNALAKLNATDRTEVDATLDTIVDVADTLQPARGEDGTGSSGH